MSTTKTEPTRVSMGFEMDRSGRDVRHESGQRTVLKMGAQVIMESCWTHCHDINTHFAKCIKCTAHNRLLNLYKACDDIGSLNGNVVRKIFDEKPDGGAILPAKLIMLQAEDWLPDDVIQGHVMVDINPRANWEGKTFVQVMQENTTDDETIVDSLVIQRDVCARRHEGDYKAFVGRLAQKKHDLSHHEMTTRALQAMAGEVAAKSPDYIQELTPDVVKLITNKEQVADIAFGNPEFMKLCRKRVFKNMVEIHEKGGDIFGDDFYSAAIDGPAGDAVLEAIEQYTPKAKRKKSAEKDSNTD